MASSHCGVPVCWLPEIFCVGANGQLTWWGPCVVAPWGILCRSQWPASPEWRGTGLPPPGTSDPQGSPGQTRSPTRGIWDRVNKSSCLHYDRAVDPDPQSKAMRLRIQEDNWKNNRKNPRKLEIIIIWLHFLSIFGLALCILLFKQSFFYDYSKLDPDPHW